MIRPSTILSREGYVDLMQVNWFGPFDVSDYEQLKSSSSSYGRSSSSSGVAPLAEPWNEFVGRFVLPLVPDKPLWIDHAWLRADVRPPENIESSNVTSIASSSSGDHEHVAEPGEGEKAILYWVDNCQSPFDAWRARQMLTTPFDLSTLEHHCVADMTILPKWTHMRRIQEQVHGFHWTGFPEYTWLNGSHMIPVGGLLMLVTTGPPPMLDNLRLGVRWREVRINP